MRRGKSDNHVKTFIIVLLCALSLRAQPAAVLRGTVTDESGGVVPGATITATGAAAGNGQRAASTATSDGEGRYAIEGLAPGAYVVSAATGDMASGRPAHVTLTAAGATLNLKLSIKAREESVTVQDSSGPAVSLESSANASGAVLRGDALDALPDDPDDLQTDLQSLAGPSAGPSGGSIYIDGFSGGEIPPKGSIREIRINQDPFSAEFDKLGYGRIEILTKPGTNNYHGTVDYNLGTDVWNSRNPYSAQKAPLLLNEFEGGASGPAGKRASFTIDAQRNMVDNGSIVNAVTLNPQTLAVQPFDSIFKTIQRYTRLSPRLDYQLSQNHTLSVRYGMTHADIAGAGIGAFDLISRGYHTAFTTQTLQVTETAVIGAAVNETRFQYYRNALQMVANTDSPVIQVLGAFNGGGSQLGHSADTQNSFEIQNYTSILHGVHAWKFGFRGRALTDDNISPVNFNGTYTFAGGMVPVLGANNQPLPGQFEQATSIERYQRTLLLEGLGYTPAQVRAAGGGASQFGINAGTPGLALNQFDFGFFAGDNWRLRPDLTVAYGLRYETQTNISDWRDFSPRLSFAWAPPAANRNHRKTVLRAGLGVFYDRFALANTLAAARYNGVVQRQYIITNPDTFPNVPPLSDLTGNQSPQAIQRVAADLRAPYVMQSALTLEHQVSASTTVAVTYTNSHGLHLLRSRDLNGPLPGTYQPGVANSGVYPFSPDTGPVMLTESSGLYNQNQMIANVNTKLGQSLTLFSFYVFNRAWSNTDGVATSPANPYSYQGEYGPAATDVHHRVTVGGAINLKWNVRLSPFVILQSGPPFNITSGYDTFGTTLYNARPGLATNPAAPGLIPTSYGLLDPNPTATEQILGRNYGRGPGIFTVNLRVSKSIGFGPERGGGGSSSGAPQLSGGQRQAAATGNGIGRLIGSPTTSRRYNLILSMSARNLLNHTNPGPITGNITSPLFGQANQVMGGPNGEGFSENASNRRLEMQLRFTF